MDADDDYEDEDFGEDDFDFEAEPCDEPVGSCEECGTNLYEEDDVEYCDQCLWRMQGGT